MEPDIVILAAGQGTRMRSSLPKVLHCLAGRPLLCHVTRTARGLSNRPPAVVIGHGADRVKECLAEEDIHWIIQEQQLGTGHAVQQALPVLQDQGVTLVLYGDVPLIREETLRELLDSAQKDCLSILTVKLQDPTGYGRIIRADNGLVEAIVEHKDATEAQRTISEVNTGIMAMPTALLRDWLSRLGNNNAQGEYYLTDIVAMAGSDGLPVETVIASSWMEVSGINNRAQLAQLERCFQEAAATRLMDAGISLRDPCRFDLRGTLAHGTDIDIDVNVVIEGDVELGDRVKIGPGCVIRNSQLGDDVVIDANSIVEGARIEARCTVGPFARLRPGADMREGAKAGNFVEIKKSVIGVGSKVSHLSYIGDSELGSAVNIGAGTITCNYDGKNKFKTEIGDGAFIGSNTALVAPVKVGAGATTAAGSVITTEVPDQALAVARGKQRNIEGWSERDASEKKEG